MKLHNIKKGRKTTTVAIITLLLIIVLFVALFMKIVTLPEVKDAITAIVAAAVIVIGFLTKDQDQTHTTP